MKMNFIVPLLSLNQHFTVNFKIKIMIIWLNRIILLLQIIIRSTKFKKPVILMNIKIKRKKYNILI